MSLFHKFVEQRACGRQRPPDVVFCLKLVSVLGLKIVILLKNSFTGVCSWKKKKAFVVCRHRSERFSLDIYSNLSQTPQLSTLQLNKLFSNAIHFTMNLELWHLKRASHIGVARRGTGAMPLKLLENIVILCFERRFSKQSNVIRLKSNISPKKILGLLRHWLNIFM